MSVSQNVQFNLRARIVAGTSLYDKDQKKAPPPATSSNVLADDGQLGTPTFVEAYGRPKSLVGNAQQQQSCY